MPDSASLERLRELLEYESQTGLFRWKAGFGHHVRGTIAGSNVGGHVNIQIDGVKIRAHRLAWLWVYGVYPTGHLDHINGVRSDNRISNLREATLSQNSANRKTRRNGPKGIYLRKLTGKYVARIMKDGKNHHLGEFSTAELAHAAYAKAAIELFGEFARLK